MGKSRIPPVKPIVEPTKLAEPTATTKIETNGHNENHSYSRVDVVMNQLSSRLDWLRNTVTDPRRNIEDECGYPTTDLVSSFCDQQYRTMAIAARVIEIFPKESWKYCPEIYEEEDENSETMFESSLRMLGQHLGGSQFYISKDDNSLYEVFGRADILSGIGRYGVIYLGFDDGQPLETVVIPRNGMRLLFARCFPEHCCEVTEFDENPLSERYGLPTMYTLVGNDSNNSKSLRIHYSRIIHITDQYHQPSTSEVYALPRLQSVWTHLYDLKKIYGADGETYWRNAVLKLFFETHPSLGGDVSLNQGQFRDAMENMMNGLQHWMVLTGMSARPVAPQVIDPTNHLDAHIQAICIKLGCPKRIFMGSERGELSSGQDYVEWCRRILGRCKTHCTSRIIVPTIDRLIWAGVLPRPKQYYVEWPEVESTTASEKADIATKLTSALAQYTTSGGDSVVPSLDFLVTFLGLESNTAKQIIDNAIAEIQDKGEQTRAPLLKLVGGITGMIELLKLAKDGGLTDEQLKQQIMLFFEVGEEEANKLIAEGYDATRQPVIPQVVTKPMQPPVDPNQFAQQVRNILEDI